MPLNGIYKPVLNKIALQQLTVPAIIPAASLGIDHAEDYQPYNLAYIRYNPQRRNVAVIPDPTFYPIEQSAASFQGNPVKKEDFPSEFYLGNPIGGF
jgi:hypothetical protein